MTGVASPDLVGIRRNLVRAVVAQGAVVVAMLAYLVLFPQGDGFGAARVAWVAVLPVMLAGAAIYQYAELKRAQEAGTYGREFNKALTQRIVRFLGVGAVLWLAVLVVLFFL